ncbi:MAG: polyprenyl synthetase family protein [Candidatus Paceibacterota bacterium]|jgi:geranylgeranyl diphosphate synthase type I
MQTEKLLSKLKADINSELQIFFENKITEIGRDHKPGEILEMVELLRDFILRSGKRIRPILFCCGYSAAGGKDRKKILKASISMELIHSYLLIHDDIIDRDDFRHGSVSMHNKYMEKYKDVLGKNACSHFGISMAIIAGDLASSFGHKVLADSKFPGDVRSKAILEMNKIISNTIVGEAMDVVLAAKDKYEKPDIIDMQIYKTAKYTIEGPLRLGAILAGADQKLLRSLSGYSIPLGIAYQIQDDVIGVFGDEKAIGKPVGSDLKEGKKTLLILKAYECGSAAQVKYLNAVIGKKGVSFGEIEKAREIIRKTGSLDFSKNEIHRLKEFALHNLNRIKMNKSYKKYLGDFADILVKREY